MRYNQGTGIIVSAIYWCEDVEGDDDDRDVISARNNDDEESVRERESWSMRCFTSTVRSRASPSARRTLQTAKMSAHYRREVACGHVHRTAIRPRVLDLMSGQGGCR